ncbi:MAG: hypothetical protein KUG56_01300 [Kordiimonadaceae bacterium]|nr:hypothetical protein [Kordiimonadaceae bacterium]
MKHGPPPVTASLAKVCAVRDIPQTLKRYSEASRRDRGLADSFCDIGFSIRITNELM